MGWEQDTVVGSADGGWKSDPIVADKEYSAHGVVGQGLTAGMANIVGAPVDLLNLGLGVVGLGSEKPVGGSAWLREGVAKIPTGSGPLTYGSIEEVPQEYRPLARGAEAVGGSVIPAAAPYATAKRLQDVSGFVRPIVRAARESPKAFAAAEAGGALGAGVGAGAAELVAPGKPLPAFAGEVVGGMLHPVAMLSRGANKVIGGVKSAMSSMTEAGRQDKAAQLLQKVLAEAGEDPEAVSRALRESGLPGVNLTAGVKSESPTLLAFEANLAKKSPTFEGVARTKAEDSIRALRSLVGELEASGNPELIKIAAKARKQYFDSLIQSRIQAAEVRAKKSADVLGGDRAASSVKANELLDDALEDVVKTEKRLWAEVPKTEQLAPDGVLSAYGNIRSSMLPEQGLPSSMEFVSRFIKRVKKDGSVSSGDLLKFRSEMLDAAREARAKSDFREARRYQELADGALNDLEKLPGEAAKTARDWSRSKHEAFSQTFAGDALGVAKSGGQRIPAEVMFERAFGGGGTLADVRMRDLEAAAQLGRKSMLPEQEQFLRAAAKATTDPQTGGVNPRALEAFIRDNGSLLERFPSLKKDLSSAASAERVFREVGEAGASASKAIGNQAAFSKVLQSENPSDAVRSALSGSNPQADFGALVKLARRGGDDAVDGLKSATLEYAARAATSESGGFSFAKYRELLTRPVSGRGPNTLQMLSESGAMKPDELGRLRRILFESEKIERGLTSRKRMGDVVGEPDALFDLVVRAVGANIGGHTVMGEISGAPIVMAGAGSRLARKFFEKLPNTKVMTVLERAAKDPDFMAMLLTKPSTPKAARELHRQVNAYLLQAGLVHREEVSELE